MHYKKLLVILLGIFFPFSIFGQAKSYTLNGVAKTKDGITYPYKLVFSLNGNSLSGYSVTTQPDGSGFKAQVKGHINHNRHTLKITETKTLGNSSKDVVICLFDADLTYKLLGEKYLVKGPFTGKGADNAPCGEGMMEFEQNNTPESFFNQDKKEAPSILLKADTTLKKELIPGDNTITAGIQKQIDWASDTCIMQIWDGGVIDGDIVTVLFNGQPVLTNYTLVKEKKELRMPLTQKVNTITIIAIDEGINPPNTAQIALFDNGGIYYKVTAYNNKGEKAVIVIRKK